MDTIVDVLMRRDHLTREEARQHVLDAHEMFLEGADPEELCMSEFGLEPDYVFDIINPY